MPGYGSDPAFEAWAQENGHTIPEGANIAAARQRGSAYLDGHYATRWPGVPAEGVEQERSWPRRRAQDRYGNPIPSDTVPKRVEYAAYEATLVEINSPGALSKSVTPGESKVLTTVGDIKWTVVDAGGKSDSLAPVLSAVEGLLAPILVPDDLPAVLVV